MPGDWPPNGKIVWAEGAGFFFFFLEINGALLLFHWERKKKLWRRKCSALIFWSHCIITRLEG